MTKDGSYAFICADIRVSMYTTKQNWNDEKPNKTKRKKTQIIIIPTFSPHNEHVDQESDACKKFR